MHADNLRRHADRWIGIKATSRPSPNSASARVSDLWSIGKALADPAEPCADKLSVLESLTVDDITLNRLEDAFAAYADTHAASSTRRVMSTWRQFCLWLVRDGHIPSNPLDQIDAPKRSAWAPKPLQPEDLAAVAEHSSQPAPTNRNPWPERDEALFALFITAGLRISEATELRVGDCYLKDDPPRLRVTGKGGKTRTVPIPPETVDLITAYLDTRRERKLRIGARTPLLLRPDGTPMTRSAIDHAVRGWFRRAGRTPPRGALAHSFRHTYATMLIDNGASLPEVQQLLGHSDLATTQAYLGVTAKGLAEASMANPARALLRKKAIPPAS